jgi:hypothetical protein
MKTLISACALVAALSLSGVASAQVPSGSAGSDAKANAPLKPAHTVNDGGARQGANSFTKGQAQQHIVNAGYSSVSDLVKGKDGVWRGTAMKNGAPVNVGLDYKGNVSEGGAMATTGTSSMTTTTATATSEAPPAGEVEAKPRHHRRHRHHHHHHVRCVSPTPVGVACSGIDRNKNGISDKEDRAINAGAKP